MKPEFSVPSNLETVGNTEAPDVFFITAKNYIALYLTLRLMICRLDINYAWASLRGRLNP